MARSGSCVPIASGICLRFMLPLVDWVVVYLVLGKVGAGWDASLYLYLPIAFSLFVHTRFCYSITLMSPPSSSLKIRSPTVHFLFYLKRVRSYSLHLGPKMCDYTQVEFKCKHLRYTVRAWCVKYQETHKRCPPNVVAM